MNFTSKERIVVISEKGKCNLDKKYAERALKKFIEEERGKNNQHLVVDEITEDNFHTYVNELSLFDRVNLILLDSTVYPQPLQAIVSEMPAEKRNILLMNPEYVPEGVEESEIFYYLDKNATEKVKLWHIQAQIQEKLAKIVPQNIEKLQVLQKNHLLFKETLNNKELQQLCMHMRRIFEQYISTEQNQNGNEYIENHKSLILANKAQRLEVNYDYFYQIVCEFIMSLQNKVAKEVKSKKTEFTYLLNIIQSEVEPSINFEQKKDVFLEKQQEINKILTEWRENKANPFLRIRKIIDLVQ